MNTGSMTKAELVEEVSRVSDLTKKHSEVIVDTVFKSIIDALHRGEKIELRGFGSFRLRRREPRKGRNPKTGDKVDVPPKKVPYFKPGKELKELINREADAPAPAVPPRGLRVRSRRSLVWNICGAPGGWPTSPVGPAPGAVFFAALLPTLTRTLIVHRGATCFVILNLFPYNNGHLMVIPNRHIASLAAATDEELRELMALTRTCEIGADRGLRAARHEHGDQPGQAGGRRRARPRPHARRPALERRHQLHDRGGPHAGAGRGTRRHRGATAADLRAAEPGNLTFQHNDAMPAVG